MVKNTTGGNKQKGQARKNIQNASSVQRLRISEDPAEIYAQVTRCLGNGMCHVVSLSGKAWLCYIRGKFRGRSKRDNLLQPGSWVLVGAREWNEHMNEPERGQQHTTTGNTGNTGNMGNMGNTVKNKLPSCDLLEVYSDVEKEKLKNTVPERWGLFIENDCNNHGTDVEQEESVVFSNTIQDEYEIYNQDKNVLKMEKISENENENEELNIDDI
jgi:translation initiation factor IF-1